MLQFLWHAYVGGLFAMTLLVILSSLNEQGTELWSLAKQYDNIGRLGFCFLVLLYPIVFLVMIGVELYDRYYVGCDASVIRTRKLG